MCTAHSSLADYMHIKKVMYMKWIYQSHNTTNCPSSHVMCNLLTLDRKTFMHLQL